MVFEDLVRTYLKPSNRSIYMNLTMCIRNLNGLEDDNMTENSTMMTPGVPIILGKLIEESALHNTSSALHVCLRELLPPHFYSSRYLMSLWQRVSWSVIFTMMLAVAAIGNAIVIWIVLAHRRMRNVTNYFLLNLALADLSMSLLNAVFNFVYLVNSDWTFGSAYCVVNSFLSNLAISSSVFSISAMSVDRASFRRTVVLFPYYFQCRLLSPRCLNYAPERRTSSLAGRLAQRELVVCS